MRAVHLERAVPLWGLAANRLRFRGLHAGLRVEIVADGEFRYGAGVSLGEGTRIDVFRGGALSFGDNVQVGRNAYVWVDPGARMSIGAGTSVQDHCRFYGNVAIGRGCVFAPNVFAASGAHTFDAAPHRTIREQDRDMPMPDRPIRILDDCWFGINTVVAPGVTVARGCVIGANAVVTRDVPPYAVAGGNPAGILRQRFDFAPGARIEAGREQDAPYFYDGFAAAGGGNDGVRVADGDFVLALARPDARAVRICVAGEGEIAFGGRPVAMPRAAEPVEFPLHADGDASPFLTFRASAPCRVHWAELI